MTSCVIPYILRCQDSHNPQYANIPNRCVTFKFKRQNQKASQQQVVVHPSGHGIQKEKNEEKKTRKRIRQRIGLHLLVRDNKWAGPWPGPSNPRTGPRKWRADPYRARGSWVSPPMSRAGPGRVDINETLMGRAGPGREKMKMRWAGPSRGPSIF